MLRRDFLKGLGAAAATAPALLAFGGPDETPVEPALVRFRHGARWRPANYSMQLELTAMPGISTPEAFAQTLRENVEHLMNQMEQYHTSYEGQMEYMREVWGLGEPQLRG